MDDYEPCGLTIAELRERDKFITNTAIAESTTQMVEILADCIRDATKHPDQFQQTIRRQFSEEILILLPEIARQIQIRSVD